MDLSDRRSSYKIHRSLLRNVCQNGGMGVGERVAKVLHVYILKKLPMSFHCTQSR